MRMQGYCDVFSLTFLRRTSPTHGVFNAQNVRAYILYGKNVNVMLEFAIFDSQRVNIIFTLTSFAFTRLHAVNINDITYRDFT